MRATIKMIVEVNMKEEVILNKMDNKEVLSYEEIKYMVNSYINNSLDEKYMKEFIMHIYKYGLTNKELFDLTDIMVKSGEVMNLNSGIYQF